MIVSLHGSVSYKTTELRKDCYFVVDVAGVGYKVYTPASNLQKITEGQEVTVFTHLGFNERSGFDLYGFIDPADKTFFTLLLDVPGIGPKSALGILDKTTMAEVQQAILSDNPDILTTVAGMSAKTAEKIIVALRDKVEKMTSKAGGKAAIAAQIGDADVLEALIGLGYSAQEAKKAIAAIDNEIRGSGERLKAALKQLVQK